VKKFVPSALKVGTPQRQTEQAAVTDGKRAAANRAIAAALK
jgi:hypothetical protein